MAQTGKIVLDMFEKAIETYEEQSNVLPLVKFIEPDPAKMQISGNVLWRSAPQHRPIISGWDTTGTATDIIKEAYPAVLGTPSNDRIQQRWDELRDPEYLMDAAEKSGITQSDYLNTQIISALVTQAAMFKRLSVTSGFDFAGPMRATMNARGQLKNDRILLINDFDSSLFAKDLAARQTIQGRPEKAWVNGKIGEMVAGFDVYESSSLPNLTGGADPATTVTGNQSFKPLPGTVTSTSSTGVVTNNDYRYASIVVADSSSYNVGDKIEIRNAGVAVKALNILSKVNTGEAMTFTVVSKPDATHLGIYPKPIAADDAALSTLEASYANINTQILNGATVNRLNVDATNQTNVFYQKDAVEVIGGTIPAGMLSEYVGWKTISKKMKNGLRMYLLYSGDIDTATFDYRLFTWYGITVANPSAVGVAVTA